MLIKIINGVPEHFKTVLLNLYKLFLSTVKTVQFSSPADFLESLKMISLFYKVEKYTMVHVTKRKVLYTLTKDIDKLNVPGDIVECGSYNGGSAALMAYVLRNSQAQRNIWLFDSFEGLPVPTEKDGQRVSQLYYKGWCKGNVSNVMEIFKKLSIPKDRIHITKGWFHDTFPAVHIPQIALLHLDADWYESIKLCLEKFYDCVQPGGFIVIDDYDIWEGCAKAVDEFIKNRNLSEGFIKKERTEWYFQKLK